ncbi:hypothetical protein GCM10009630_06850 [Kribbella jejuensis]
MSLPLIKLRDLKVPLPLQIHIPELNPQVLRRLNPSPPPRPKPPHEPDPIHQRSPHHSPRPGLLRSRRLAQPHLCSHRAIVPDPHPRSQKGLAHSPSPGHLDRPSNRPRRTCSSAWAARAACRDPELDSNLQQHTRATPTRRSGGEQLTITIASRPAATLGPLKQGPWRHFADVATVLQPHADTDWTTDRDLIDQN